MKNRNPILTAILSALTCFAFLQQTQAVEPATPDPGPRPVTNTADGQTALFSITTGLYNSAFGFDALLSNSTSNFNTGLGAGALLLNNGNGTCNVAIGDEAGTAYDGSESHNICIGAGTGGSAGDNNTIRIGTGLPSGGIGVLDAGPAANFVLIGAGLNTQGISIGTL